MVYASVDSSSEWSMCFTMESMGGACLSSSVAIEPDADDENRRYNNYNNCNYRVRFILLVGVDVDFGFRGSRERSFGDIIDLDNIICLKDFFFTIV